MHIPLSVSFYPKKSMNKIIGMFSRATKFLQGPLDKKVYVLCAAYDRENQSAVAARNEGIEAVQLPVTKYIK